MQPLPEPLPIINTSPGASGCRGQIKADAPAPGCPPLLPSSVPPWRGGRTALLAFQAVGRAAAAVPACCLADGEIISKPFPFPPPPSLAGPHWLSPWDSVQSLPLKQDSWPGSLPPRTPQPSPLAGKGASRSFQKKNNKPPHSSWAFLQLLEREMQNEWTSGF